MRRHPSLAPLSREHLPALMAGRALRDLPADAGEAEGRAAAAAFLAFWRSDGSAHFRGEEELLLPWFSRHAQVDRPEIVRMLLEHAELRGRIAAVAERLAEGGAPTAAALRDLGTRFMAHVRLEEDVVFPMMEAAVPPEALEGPSGPGLL